MLMLFLPARKKYAADRISGRIIAQSGVGNRMVLVIREWCKERVGPLRLAGQEMVYNFFQAILFAAAFMHMMLPIHVSALTG
jgi:hypothetical protein